MSQGRGRERRGWRAGLAWLTAYQGPLRAATARDGPLAAPASLAFLGLTLAVSAGWRLPASHHLVEVCCAYRAADLVAAGRLGRLLGSAFLAQRAVEVLWTLAASWLVLAPLEVAVGGRRMLAVGFLGHVVPTVLVGLWWLAWRRASQPAVLDVGTSAVIVTCAAALAVRARSAPIGLVLVAALTVDVLTAPDLATVEHLLCVLIGVAAGLVPAGRARPAPIPVSPGRRAGRER